MKRSGDGGPIGKVQRLRLLSVESYVCGPLQISAKEVGSIKNLVALVNEVFEANITYSGNDGRAIDEMWGYVSALSKTMRKKLRNKNLSKVPYTMKGAMSARRRAQLDKAAFYSKGAAEARKESDRRLLETVKASPIKAKPSSKPVSQATKDEFYKSWQWRTLRMEVLKEHGRACQCCGSKPGMTTADGSPVRIVVDHIKPISKYWGLRLDRSNLQILCDECNMGKGNWDETDFRPPTAPDEWIIEDDGIDQAILEQLSHHGETIQ